MYKWSFRYILIRKKMFIFLLLFLFLNPVYISNSEGYTVYDVVWDKEYSITRNKIYWITITFTADYEYILDWLIYEGGTGDNYADFMCFNEENFDEFKSGFESGELTDFNYFMSFSSINDFEIYESVTWGQNLKAYLVIENADYVRYGAAATDLIEGYVQIKKEIKETGNDTESDELGRNEFFAFIAFAPLLYLYKKKKYR